MKTVEQLAREAGSIDSDEVINTLFAAFSDLAIAQYRESLLAGVGEAVAYLAWRDGKPCYEGDDAVCEDAVWPVDWDDDRESMPVYTADQMAAAVAIERERCAKVCEEDAFVEQWKGLAEAAQRIRTRGQR